MKPRLLLASAAGVFALVTGVFAQGPKPVLYVVGTSHLDSQWNWTVQDSIRRFVPATFFENFDRFEKYPNYVFSYEGAIHYMWFKEYYPEAWPKLQKYVADGRWRIAGNWINAVDVNVPAPESLMRHALYAKRFFRQEFGKAGTDVYLPDCFGFGFALPSIAAHSGLNAFTTQKLTWGSSYGIPFPIGRWKGVDGSEVVAALNPGDYVTRITSDVSTDPKWSNDPTTLGNGRSVIYRLFGVGDVGGAPTAESVDWLEKSLANKNGAVEVRSTSVDQLANDLTAAEKAALPVYEGELTMKTHGVGTHTSQAAMKKFNRENELLAAAAERASVAATWIDGAVYPADRLREAWLRVLWHHFHDDITGTAIPQAYQFSWNDEIVSLNQFAGMLTHAAGLVSSQMQIESVGVPLVVYNPAGSERTDPVEATLDLPAGAPRQMKVIDLSTGAESPVQVLERQGDRARILFAATMPSVGFKAFDLRPGVATTTARGPLSVTTSSLDNARYTVKIDANGDISSVFDREAGRELLRAPVRLEMRDDPSPDKPAWRILWDTVKGPVREYVSRPSVRVVESGPVRVAVEITREAAGSTIVQKVMLAQGGDRVDVESTIDWKSTNTLLKASFQFAASNPKATYDLGLGTIQRGNDTPDAYEVPAQWWADITDTSGAFGAAVLNDSKYGWDKPADNTLRLTLLHSPKPGAWPRPFYQASQDLGRHQFTYSIAGHASDWRAGDVPLKAARLNQPLVAFLATNHSGSLGRAFSLASLSGAGGQVAIRAIKKAEDSDEIVVRVQELFGQPARTTLGLAGKIVAVREVNAAEEPIGPMAPTADGKLEISLRGYQPRTFAVRLAAPAAPVVSPIQQSPALVASNTRAATPLELPFNLDGISLDTSRADGNFDGHGLALAGEQWRAQLVLNGVPFSLGSSRQGQRNVLVPAGQSFPVSMASASANARMADRVYVLATAVGGDAQATFGFERTRVPSLSPTTVTTTVRDWQAPIGQWYSPLKTLRMLFDVVTPEMRGQTWTEAAIRDDMVTAFDPATGVVSGIDQIRPAFVTRDEIAWVGTHRHAADGNQIYVPSYVFLYRFDMPAGTSAFKLPNDSRLRVFAVTVVREPRGLTVAGPLYAKDLPNR